MDDRVSFLLFSLIVAFLGGRHAAIGNTVDNWLRLCMGKDSLAESVAKDARSGVDAPASLFMHSVVEPQRYQELRDALRPPFYMAKTAFFWLANAALCISAFFFLPWYFAVVFPAALFLAIQLFCRASTAVSGGFKNRILVGLQVREEVEMKMGSRELAGLYSSLHDVVKNLTYRA